MLMSHLQNCVEGLFHLLSSLFFIKFPKYMNTPSLSSWVSQITWNKCSKSQRWQAFIHITSASSISSVCTELNCEQHGTGMRGTDCCIAVSGAALGGTEEGDVEASGNGWSSNGRYWVDVKDPEASVEGHGITSGAGCCDASACIASVILDCVDKAGLVVCGSAYVSCSCIYSTLLMSRSTRLAAKTCTVRIWMAQQVTKCVCWL